MEIDGANRETLKKIRRFFAAQDKIGKRLLINK